MPVSIFHRHAISLGSFLDSTTSLEAREYCALTVYQKQSDMVPVVNVTAFNLMFGRDVVMRFALGELGLILYGVLTLLCLQGGQ